jgi:hypothetical protein
MERSLGTLIVTTDGSGYWSNRKASVPVEVSLSVDAVERELDGSIEFAVCHLRLKYEDQHWNEETDGLMYTDKAVERQVNQFIKSLGYEGQVNWSEQGMQERNVGDMDADYDLIWQVFPEIPKIMKDAA